MAASSETPIGSLKRRLVLEAPVATPDGLGGSTLAYETVASVWARIEWLRGGEEWARGRPEQRATHRITLRWRAGVDAGQRLRHGATIYDIRAVLDPDGGRHRLVCIVEETRS